MNEGLQEIKDPEELVRENSANEQSGTKRDDEASQGRKSSESYSESDWQTQKSSGMKL